MREREIIKKKREKGENQKPRASPAQAQVRRSQSP